MGHVTRRKPFARRLLEAALADAEAAEGARKQDGEEEDDDVSEYLHALGPALLLLVADVKLPRIRKDGEPPSSTLPTRYKTDSVCLCFDAGSVYESYRFYPTRTVWPALLRRCNLEAWSLQSPNQNDSLRPHCHTACRPTIVFFSLRSAI